MATQRANNGYQSNDEAAKAAHIYYAIMVTWKRLWEFAVKTIESPTSRLSAAEITEFKTMHFDFNEVVRFIENKWKEGSFDKLPNEKLLRSYLRRCPNIRNLVSHQRYVDSHNTNRAIETLCHVLEETDFHVDAQNIRDFGKPITAQASDRKPSDVPWEQLKQQANQHYQQGQYTEAMIIYTEAIKDNPNVPALYSSRALCELRLERFDDARNDAEDALHLDPECVEYHRILADALMKLELVEEALAVCKRGLQLDPEDSVLLIRVRDLVAVMAMHYTDKNPRKHIKEGVEGIPELTERVLKFLDKCAGLKPYPNDIDVIDESHTKEHFEKYFKLDKPVREGHNYYNGVRGRSKNDRRAFECFKNAADLGSAEGQYNLGLLYATGHGTNVDYGLMLKYYYLAASHKPFVSVRGDISPVLGVADAENGLGCAYRDGRGVDRDMKKAFSHYIKAANWGHPEAQNNTGSCLYRGEGVAKNQQFARMWYERAAKQEIAEGQLNYAILLESGEGGPRDEHLAWEYFRKAAEQGCPGALEKLQYMSSNGAATNTQLESARAMTFNSLKKNDAQTLHFVGTECKDMDDCDSAIELWTKASEQGHMESTVALWKVLLKKTQRNREAFAYCTKASEAGDPQSQLALADLLAKGIGCKRDSEAARKWFRRAQHHFNLDAKQFDETISAAKILCDFEESHSLLTESLSWNDRMQRHLERAANLPCVVKDSLVQLIELRKQPKALPLSVRLLAGENGMLAVIDAAENGSVTARNVLKASWMIGEASNAWESHEYDQAFTLLRQSHRCDHTISFEDSNIAAYIDERKLTTSDAMFVRACNFGNEIKGSIVYLERSIRFHPREADLHHLLASCYSFAGRYEEALSSARRAYELDPLPIWLYVIATATRMLCESASPQERGTEHWKKLKADALQAYQQYLEENPKDDRKVPAALYSIASLYCFDDADVPKVKDYYRWACEADARRLPCFPPVDADFGPKQIVEIYLNALKANLVLPPLSNDEKEQPNNCCQGCEKAGPIYVCVCREARYCSPECQKSNWRTHKPGCKAKFDRMQKLRKI